MSQQVSTTLVEHEPKQLNGSNGSFTLHIFKDAGGTRFQTSKKQIADQAFGLIGQPVTITYSQRQNGEYMNNMLEAIVAGGVANGATGAPTGAVPAATGAPQTASAPSGGGNPSEAQRAKEIRIMRQSGLQRAIDTVNAGVVQVANIAELYAISENFVKYFAGGPSAAGVETAAQPQGTAAPEPVAAGAPASSELAPGDDIPFLWLGDHFGVDPAQAVRPRS